MKLRYFFVLYVLFVSGCTNQCVVSTPVSGVQDSSLLQQEKQINFLQNKHVQVIQLGDELRLVIPTKILFFHNAHVLKVGSIRVLDQIVHFLNQRKNLGIEVLAYTPSLEVADDFKPNISLEKLQAETIMDYLLQHGLNTRLITATAWSGVSEKQMQGTNSFSNDAPGIFTIEIRTRLLEPEDSQ